MHLCQSDGAVESGKCNGESSVCIQLTHSSLSQPMSSSCEVHGTCGAGDTTSIQIPSNLRTHDYNAIHVHQGPPKNAGLKAAYLRSTSGLKLGYWNVRSLLDEGSQCLTMRTLWMYGIDVACLSEVRIPGSGSRRIEVPQEQSSYWLYHSGPVDGSGTQGVAFAVSSSRRDAVIEWEPISPRIARIRFLAKPMNITIISV